MRTLLRFRMGCQRCSVMVRLMMLCAAQVFRTCSAHASAVACLGMLTKVTLYLNVVPYSLCGTALLIFLGMEN